MEGESDEIFGAGRALPHAGLSALQPAKNSTVSTSALSTRKKTLIGFIRHRTPGQRPIQFYAIVRLSTFQDEIVRDRSTISGTGNPTKKIS